MTVCMMLVRIGPGWWEGVFPSSLAISRAREVRDVRGIRCVFRACWAVTRRSHSSAMAEARCGFWWGMVRMSLLGVRMGWVSRRTW